MANGFILGEDKQVAAWAFATFNLFPVQIERALGIVNAEGVLIGAILFRNYNGFNIDLSYYGPATLSLGIVRSIARIASVDYNVARGTLITSKRKKHLISSLQKFGWKVEGAQRCQYGHEDCNRNTAIRMVIFREQIDKLARLPVAYQVQKQG